MDANMIHLVEALEKRPQLLNGSNQGESAVDIKKKKDLWTEVIRELRTLGITKFGTDVTTISKSVSNFKYRTKKKVCLTQNAENDITKGSELYPLNSVEEKMLRLMGYACVNGMWRESEPSFILPCKEEPSSTQTTQEEVQPPPKAPISTTTIRTLRKAVQLPPKEVLLGSTQSSNTIQLPPTVQVIKLLVENKPANDTIGHIPSIQTPPVVENEDRSSSPLPPSDHLQPSTSKSKEESKAVKFRPLKRKGREFRSRFSELLELEKEKMSIKRERLKLENRKVDLFQDILGELRLLNDKVDEFIEKKES